MTLRVPGVIGTKIKPSTKPNLCTHPNLPNANSQSWLRNLCRGGGSLEITIQFHRCGSLTGSRVPRSDLHSAFGGEQTANFPDVAPARTDRRLKAQELLALFGINHLLPEPSSARPQGNERRQSSIEIPPPGVCIAHQLVSSIAELKLEAPPTLDFGFVVSAFAG